MEKYTFVIIGVVFVVALIVNIVLMKKRKHATDAFLANHPDAAKVFPSVKVTAVTQGSVTIHSVDGEAATMAVEKTKYFLYVIPGTRILEASFSSSRPGVMHKTVTKTWGPAKLEVDIKPNGRYELQFDKETESFQLVEI